MELIEDAAKRNPGFFLALVGPTDLEFGMARMMEAFSHNAPYRVNVFRDRQNADAWIREVVGQR